MNRKSLHGVSGRALTRGMLLAAAVSAAMRLGAAQAFVTYEQHGAVGDGKTDDRAAIVAAHAAANAKGLPVRAMDGKTYLLGKGKESAIIKTDTDFGTAKFIIDDVDIKSLRSPSFQILPSREHFRVKDLKPFKRGTRNLGVTLPMDCLVIVEDSNVRQYIRFGKNQNKGFPQKDILIVRRDGSVDPLSPVLWDFKNITKATAYPIDEKPLTVKGGVFVTIANRCESKYRYHYRGIHVDRSNTTISGVRHEITGEKDHGAPYAGFIVVSKSVGVKVENCVLTGRKTYWTESVIGGKVPMGSYGLSAGESVDVRFVNCRQTNDINDRRFWGIFGSNYCKALLFDGCELSRFDAHMGVCGATILNCKLGHQGLNAIGSGTLRIENTEIRSGSFINLRPDYGCTWEGDFIVRNCRFVPIYAKHYAPALISGSYTGKHDFGYVCHMPEKMVFDGLFIDDTVHPAKYDGPFVLKDFNSKNTSSEYKEEFPYQITEEVVLRNVKTASGKPISLSPNKYMFRNVKMSVDGIRR